MVHLYLLTKKLMKFFSYMPQEINTKKEILKIHALGLFKIIDI